MSLWRQRSNISRRANVLRLTKPWMASWFYHRLLKATVSVWNRDTPRIWCWASRATSWGLFYAGQVAARYRSPTLSYGVPLRACKRHRCSALAGPKIVRPLGSISDYRRSERRMCWICSACGNPPEGPLCMARYRYRSCTPRKWLWQGSPKYTLPIFFNRTRLEKTTLGSTWKEPTGDHSLSQPWLSPSRDLVWPLPWTRASTERCHHGKRAHAPKNRWW